METLNKRAENFDVTAWTVVKFAFSDPGKPWTACGPGDEDYAFEHDKDFETFAEAIEYAQKQARQ